MRPLLVVLPLLVTLAGCGGDDERLDLGETCTRVAQAWPGNLYDDHANAIFARELGRVLEAAEPSVRRRFEDVVTHVGLVVAAAGDNTAVVTESVEVRAALEPVNEACSAADAPTID